jgi:HTH-type transcriptional regulator/antitoxin HigA
MAAKQKREYQPDRVSPPGDSLLSLLEERSITQADLARRMGRPTKTVNEIVKGVTSITPETALELESVLGTPAQFWLNREAHYREFVARREREVAARSAVAWVRQFPLAALAKAGCISLSKASEASVAEVFRFFGVANVAGWERTWQTAEAQFRRSPTKAGNRYAVAAWLRRGTVAAQEIETRTFDALTFERVLNKARSLTVEEPEVFQQELTKQCARAGVALAWVPHIPGVPVHAVTRWLSAEKALVQLSLYYRTDDHLWFSFFHEASHVLSQKRKTVFLDGAGDCYSEDEREADEFARDFLIPKTAYEAFRREGAFDAVSVRRLAKAQGISPGIVVGRLQHDRVISFAQLNSLKRRFQWTDGS